MYQKFGADSTSSFMSQLQCLDSGVSFKETEIY